MAAAVGFTGLVLWLTSMLAALVSLVLRFRASRGTERQQLRWVVAGAAGAVAGLLVGMAGVVMTYFAVLCVPAGVAVAVLRYRLWDLDRLVSRTVTYALVTALLVIPYLLVVPTASKLVEGSGSLAVAAATLTVAALFQPLRRRVQDLVDRRFNRRRYDAARTVDGFAARLRDQVDLDALHGELLAVVDQTMQPTRTSPVARGPGRPAPGSFTKLEPAPVAGANLRGPGCRRQRTHGDEVNLMRGLGRRTRWLGWAVAGVLLVSAGGAALAAQDATTTTQAPGVSADKARARAGALGRGGGWRHALGRRVLHGEVTVQTQEGVKTLVMAYGTVSALSKDAITVKSSDGVETSFKLDGDTRFGFRNEPAPSAELKAGEDAFVTGEKSGDSTTARRVVSGELARRGAGNAGKATPSLLTLLGRPPAGEPD